MPLSDQSPTMPQDAPPKRRGPGRPKGSKNKPKNPVDQVASELRGNGDSAPRRKKRVSKKTTEAIEAALAEILTAPSMATAIIGDEWATQHFIQNGKELAARIAAISERHPQLRKWCEAMLEGESVMVVALAAFAYVFPPLVHFNVIPAPDILGIPKRPTARKPRMAGDSPTMGTEWDAEGIERVQRAQAEAAMRAENERRAAANGAEPEPHYFEGEGPPTFV